MEHSDASMRPRQACLGILLLTHLPQRIHPGFNEAEASLPRNTSTRSCIRPSIYPASMRPRQACLGILHSFNRSVVQYNSFNEAEASLPRNT